MQLDPFGISALFRKAKEILWDYLALWVSMCPPSRSFVWGLWNSFVVCFLACLSLLKSRRPFPVIIFKCMNSGYRRGLACSAYSGSLYLTVSVHTHALMFVITSSLRCSLGATRLPTAVGPLPLVTRTVPYLSHSNRNCLASLHTSHINNAHSNCSSKL